MAQVHHRNTGVGLLGKFGQTELDLQSDMPRKPTKKALLPPIVDILGKTVYVLYTKWTKSIPSPAKQVLLFGQFIYALQWLTLISSFVSTSHFYLKILLIYGSIQ